MAYQMKRGIYTERKMLTKKTCWLGIWKGILIRDTYFANRTQIFYCIVAKKTMNDVCKSARKKNSFSLACNIKPAWEKIYSGAHWIFFLWKKAL